MNTAVFIKGSKEKSKILKNENWKKKMKIAFWNLRKGIKYIIR